ncbi:MAG: D-glycero-beta-D-manno-heptose-7-phosphate kinase [Nitrospira bacterium HGW-Nitrospira-1]|nr:MAG: D-glycero-beta-D-manno-heptose-7-phosphate kinase [Nitrospira bacterium HGW-Nitrospira-1]
MVDYKKIIRGFKDRNILVIGDIILDHYIWGKVTRISPEAPVPVVEVTRESFLLGGAANVAHNITSLGGRASVVGINGQDIAGEALMNILSQKGVNCDGIFTENRPTTVKTRVIAHNQQVVRFDREDKKYVDGKILKGILGYLNSVITLYDAVIVSDYQKGMVSSELIRDIVKKAKPKDMFIAVDPKVGHFDFYKGVSLITPNVMEASVGSHIEIKDDKTLLKAGKNLMKKLSCKAVLITRGEQGMSLFEKNKVTHIPTVARKVYDVTGAGDTVISAFTLAYVSGADMEEAAVIANHAAGIVVGEVGTAVATPEQLLTVTSNE